MIKKITSIFALAFLTNLLWEEFQSPLYTQYRGGDITQLILLKAALFDAAFIVILGVVFLQLPFLRKQLWLSLIFGVCFAVGLEWWALATHRWAYAPAMPIIPLLNSGLTPTIQLGVISYVLFKIFKLNEPV